MAHNQRGFTIVELMISISVFSVVIILASAAIITVGRQYQFGVSKTRILDASRELNQKISQDIAYSGAPVSDTEDLGTTGYKRVCIGGNRYLWKQAPNGSTDNSAYVDSFTIQKIGDAITCDSTADLITNTQKPLPSGTVVTQFSISSTNPSDYKSQFVFGDPDLLNGGSGYNKGGVVGDNTCVAQVVGGSYCAVVDMNSTITRKVQ